jgi:hypothetical protein
MEAGSSVQRRHDSAPGIVCAEALREVAGRPLVAC